MHELTQQAWVAQTCTLQRSLGLTFNQLLEDDLWAFEMSHMIYQMSVFLLAWNFEPCCISLTSVGQDWVGKVNFVGGAV